MNAYWLEILIVILAIYGSIAIIKEVIEAYKTRQRLSAKLTVILKVANQEEAIEGIIRKTLKLKGQVGDFKLIVIDSGSFDDTLPILTRLQYTTEGFDLLTIKQPISIMELIEKAPGQVICYLDLEEDLEIIKNPAKIGRIIKEIV